MRRAVEFFPAGDWPQCDCVGGVTLAFNDRHRRRIRMTDDEGEPFLLDLAAAVRLADGDGLGLQGGGIVRVTAAAEPVADVVCATAPECVRIAWHMGNRHTAVQILSERSLRILDDHVLVHMAEGLGGEVSHLHAPFAPEPGAYAAGGHDHEH